MNVWKKKTVRYLVNGKRCSKGTKGAKPKTEKSKRFYGTLKLSDGKTKQVPLTEDEGTSLAILRRLQSESDHDRVLGITPRHRERQKPISEHVEDYLKLLRSSDNTPCYVAKKEQRLRSLVEETNAKTVEDLQKTRIADVLSCWRKNGRGKKRFGVTSSNHYVKAIKGFTRWLVNEGKIERDPLASLRLMNEKTDVRHQRRAFTTDELNLLLEVTQTSQKTYRGRTWTFSPTDRVMLYRIAVQTGLRAGELASLTVHSFDLEAKTVTVEASFSKRRRKDVLPLHTSLVERLRDWLPSKADKLFPGEWMKINLAGKMIKRDLKRAGIPYRDPRGRVLDFHALRHTFVTQLARAAVHPAKAKELARHSTITLTMDFYSHVETEELRDAIDSVPGLG